MKPKSPSPVSYLSLLVFSQNVNYTSTHFALNPDHFPAYMPDMRFNTKLVFQLGRNITLIRASVDAEVMRRS